ncbi:MAG TPA: hypothetical protein ENG16_04270 [Archaeoglobus sp.]|nr:hypothetical protein [Archaeoglobus sp.]
MIDFAVRASRSKKSIVVRCPRCGRWGRLHKCNRCFNVNHGDKIHSFCKKDKYYNILRRIYDDIRSGRIRARIVFDDELA